MKKLIAALLAATIIAATFTSCNTIRSYLPDDPAGELSSMDEQPYDIGVSAPPEITAEEKVLYAAVVGDVLRQLAENGALDEDVATAKELYNDLLRYSGETDAQGVFMYNSALALKNAVAYTMRRGDDAALAQSIADCAAAAAGLTDDEKEQVKGVSSEYIQLAAAACKHRGDKNYNEALVTFGGDISFNNDYTAVESRRFDFWYSRRGGIPQPQFAPFGSVFKTDDVTVVNNLTTYYNSNDSSVGRDLYNASPDLAGVMSAGGVEIASVANRHTRDYFEAGYSATVETVKATGVTTLENNYPLEQTVNGVPVTLIAYDTTAQEVTDQYALDMQTQIKMYKSGGSAVAVYFYWGLDCVDNGNKPTALMKRLARYAVDAGADIVIGNGPCIVQGAEYYNGKYIFYSLGELVCGADYELNTRYGITVTAAFGNVDGVNTVTDVSVTPYFENSNGTEDTPDFLPTPQFGAKGDAVIDYVLRMSGELENGVQSLNYFNPTGGGSR